MAKRTKMLDRAAILGADDLRRERVKVPEWGGDVYVCTMSALELAAWQDANMAEGGIKTGVQSIGVMTSLVAATVRGGDGEPVFSPEDAEALSAKHPAAINRVSNVAMDLNGLNEKSAADLEKN